MKRVAVVGFGFMGRTHYSAWTKCRGAKVTAVCDSNLAQMSAKVKGNISGVGGDCRIGGEVKVFSDYGEMLSRGGFDIVDLTLPTPFHPAMAVAALERGFHVLCEKPMALTLGDCDRMLAAADKAGRRLLVAHCVRFFPEYAALRKIVESGKYGKVTAAEFTRYMAVPKWSPDGGSWLLDEKKSGGLYLDAHIHDADYIFSLFGKPEYVTSRLHKSPHGYVDHMATIYDYPGMMITSSSSFAASDSLVWDASARVFLEKASVYLGGASRMGRLTVYPEGGKPFAPRLSALNGYEAEIRYFLDCVEGREKEKPLTPADAREAVRIVRLERRSAELARRIRVG